MRKIVLSLVLVSLVWLVGLAAFISALPRPSIEAKAASDAVIVYTGGGGARIRAGMALLSEGAASRLLISGVNPDIARETVADFWTGTPELFACCVDLGHEAQSTAGNASEAAQWAATHNARRVILVTSDFHMPRALAETRAAMPEAEITPYVVASSYLDDDGRPASRNAWEKLAGEYNKFLLAKIKSVLPLPRN